MEVTDSESLKLECKQVNKAFLKIFSSSVDSLRVFFPTPFPSFIILTDQSEVTVL